MPPRKTPTSSLPVIELLAKRALYRTLARIRKIRSGGAPRETPPTHCSPAARLPFEVVEMFIAYLKYDTASIRACTMTCYSWYMAAVPYLHRTLTVNVDPWDRKHRWPSPILYMHMLGSLPLVKEFRVRGGGYFSTGFSPKLFNYCILRQFSALSNVQDLEIEYLEIAKFMPKIRRYFKNFLPTVRSLVLREPKGSRRQIIYFIGLFQCLQDLELRYDSFGIRDESGDDSTLIPPSVPPLQGWLKLTCVKKPDILRDMIALFGGLRFRYVCLYDVDQMGPLLDACAKTLEVVVLDPTDPRAESSLWDFDLSRNKSLRTIQVQANAIGNASRFLKHVLSTITSPVFCKVIVLYGTCHFRGIESRYPSRAIFRGLSPDERVEEIARHRRLFEVFREMNGVRNFHLILCACILGSVGEEPVRILEEAVAEENARGGFDHLLSDPLVDYCPR